MTKRKRNAGLGVRRKKGRFQKKVDKPNYNIDNTQATEAESNNSSIILLENSIVCANENNTVVTDDDNSHDSCNCSSWKR